MYCKRIPVLIMNNYYTAQVEHSLLNAKVMVNWLFIKQVNNSNPKMLQSDGKIVVISIMMDHLE